MLQAFILHTWEKVNFFRNGEAYLKQPMIVKVTICSTNMFTGLSAAELLYFVTKLKDVLISLLESVSAAGVSHPAD